MCAKSFGSAAGTGALGEVLESDSFLINLSFQSPKLFPSIVTDFLADGSPNNVSLIYEQ